jgi:hypothetical protein
MILHVYRKTFPPVAIIRPRIAFGSTFAAGAGKINLF